MNSLFKWSCFFFLLVSGWGAKASTPLDIWMQTQETASFDALLRNISPTGTVPGVVVASPSKTNPDYFYHWVRDAALTMDVLVRKYQDPSTSTAQRNQVFQMLMDFIHFSRRNQLTETPSGSPGEPKFHVDGKAFTGPWGRPQNDGPALRALTLTKLARYLLSHGQGQLVIDHLYRAELPATTVIKADLEFVSHHWKDASFDLWEEVSGDHFYTRMVQRRSLIEGAKLAREMGDPNAAAWYEIQAAELSQQIEKHWNAGRGILEVTLNWQAGAPYKLSQLDSAIVLGVLHAAGDDGFFSASDPRVLSTADVLTGVFRNLYKVNSNGAPGVGIGRYPEDRYDGYRTDFVGNPWFLITAGFAELYYQAAKEIQNRGIYKVTSTNLQFLQRLGIAAVQEGSVILPNQPAFPKLVKSLFDLGDSFMERIRFHSPDGVFSEQFHRESGYRFGAPDLTWSYAAVLTAGQARK